MVLCVDCARFACLRYLVGDCVCIASGVVRMLIVFGFASNFCCSVYCLSWCDGFRFGVTLL